MCKQCNYNYHWRLHAYAMQNISIDIHTQHNYENKNVKQLPKGIRDN